MLVRFAKRNAMLVCWLFWIFSYPIVSVEASVQDVCNSLAEENLWHSNNVTATFMIYVLSTTWSAHLVLPVRTYYSSVADINSVHILLLWSSQTETADVIYYVAELTVQQSWDESSYSSCFIVQGRAGYGWEFSSHLTGKSVQHLFSVLEILSQSQVIVCRWEIQVRKVGYWQLRNFNLGNCSCWFLSYAEKSKTADCIYPVCLGVPRTVLKQKKTSGCHQFLSL